MARTFTVDLLTLAEPFARWCASRGKTRSTALRELVGQALLGEEESVVNPSSIANTYPVEEQPREERQTRRERRFTLRLCDEELGRLHKQSAAAGLPAARYLACLLAAAERGETWVAGNEALEALTESNHHVAWIGRNLNLGARGSGGPQETGTCPESAEVKEMLEVLRRHLANAAAVLANIESSRTRVPHRAHWFGGTERKRRWTKNI